METGNSCAYCGSALFDGELICSTCEIRNIKVGSKFFSFSTEDTPKRRTRLTRFVKIWAKKHAPDLSEREVLAALNGEEPIPENVNHPQGFAFPISEEIELARVIGAYLQNKEETSKVARPTALKGLNEDENDAQDLTARGTPRIRKPMRSREQVGGDPRLEVNRDDVKLGGRIPRELRTEFVAALKDHNLHQGLVLTELIESYLSELKNNEPK